LEEALKEASLGITTPENRIRRNMSQPADISHEKEAMPQQKRRKVVKVIKRKVATPQEGQALPAPARTEAPPSGPTAPENAHDHLTTQLVSPVPARAEQATHEHADAAAQPEQVSPPIAPATIAPAEAEQVSASTAAAPHRAPETAMDTAPETAPEATQPAPTELPARPAAPGPRVNERVVHPPQIPAKTEPATPGSAVNVKREHTEATSSIPSKQEPMTEQRRRAVEQAKQDNMQRSSTQSQLGSPAGPSTRMPNTNASQSSGPANGAAPPVARGPPAAHPAAPAQPPQATAALPVARGPPAAHPAAPAQRPQATAAPPVARGPPAAHPAAPAQRPQATAAGQEPADSEDGRSNHDDETRSVGGYSSTTSFSQALERDLTTLLENQEGGERETRRNEDNRDTAQPAVPRRRRARTVEEKAIHAKFMRFTRHIQSFLSY